MTRARETDVEPKTETGAYPTGDETVTLGGEGEPPIAYQPEHPEYEPGDCIDRYEITSRLGAGGMGVVYAARDPELDRAVAIKVVRPDRVTGASSEGVRARLLREAKALARLSHPNVIPVHDAGTVDGDVFVAMELAPGTTFKQWIEDEDPGWREIVRAVIDAGAGIAAAHAAGIVHRDVKPSNLLIGDDGRVRVLDFGLARPAGGPAEPRAKAGDEVGGVDLDTPLTESGALVGTPAYMAPELFAGAGAGEAADQFGLFVTLYEGLYGERPFPGRSPLELAAAMERGQRRPLPRRPSLPRSLRRALDRGLAVDPDDRYPDMNAAIDALRAATGQRKVAAAAAAAVAGAAALAIALALAGGEERDACAAAGDLTGAWNDEDRAAAREAFAAIDGGAGAFPVVARGVDAYAEAWSASARDACVRARDELDPPPMRDARARCLAERRVVLDTFAASLAEVSSREHIDRAAIAVHDLDAIADCSDAALLAARAPPEDPEVRDAVVALEEKLARARALSNTGAYREARALAGEVFEEASGYDYAPLTARAGYELGVVMRNLDEEGADDVLREAARAAAVAQDDLTAAQAWRRVFRHLKAHRENEGRLRELEELIPIVESAVLRAGNDAVRVLWLRDLGLYHAARQDHERALETFRAAVDHAEETLGPDARITGDAIAALGDGLHANGMLEEARAAYERALRLRERHYGPEHPSAAESLAQLGKVHGGLEQYAEALDYQQRAAAIRAVTHGKDSARYADSVMSVGRTESQLGRHDDAIAHTREALAALTAALGPRHSEVGVAETMLALALKRSGDTDGARAAFDRALAIYRETYGAEHPQYAITMINAAELDMSAGDADAALPRFREAHRIFAATLGPDHPITSQSSYAVGAALLDGGDAAAALPHLERAHACERCPPSVRYAAAFALARALWDGGGNKTRATALAREALAVAESSPARTEQDVAELRAWLAKREH